MQQPGSPAEPPSSDQATAPASTTDERSRAVEAMIATIERLDELGLNGVEPLSAFLWT